MELELLSGSLAVNWMNKTANRHQWHELNTKCPWATPYQSPEFAKSWSQYYSAQWQPLLVLAWRGTNLCGVLPLAVQGNAVRALGVHQAEYVGPSCAPEDAAAFLKCAWDNLTSVFPRAYMRLRYLLPDLEQPAKELIETGTKGRIILHKRPLLAMQKNEIEQVLKKKGNRSKINRLHNIGKLHFEIIRADKLTSDELNEIIALYDFRQGVVHNCCPFNDDPAKRLFHQQWFRQAPEHFLITCTRINNKIVAAFIGVICGDYLANAIVAYSPFWARYSPGKFHIYWTAQAAQDSGLIALDLTPGNDLWKERFMTSYETVYELELWASRYDAFKVQMKEASVSFAKGSLEQVGIKPYHVRKLVKRLKHIRPKLVIRHLIKKLPKQIEYRIYRIRVDPGQKHIISQEIVCNDLSALARFKPSESWHNRQTFLESALKRLENGEKIYCIVHNNQLIHYGWLVPHQERAWYTEVQQWYCLPEPGAVLYDFYTHPSWRGKGYYQGTIQYILDDLRAQVQQKCWAYISVLGDNIPSRHVIEKLGFEYIESLYF